MGQGRSNFLRVILHGIFPAVFIFAAPLHAATEGVCGSNNLRQVNAPTSISLPNSNLIQTAKSAVGVIAVQTNSGETLECSGTLISPEHFLTARHCVTSYSIHDLVYFNYEKKINQTQEFSREAFSISAITEPLTRSDFAILTLSGKPGMKYGWNEFGTSQLSIGMPVTIIQHPSGETKQFDFGTIRQFMQAYILHNVDTMETSSGSGILNDDGKIIAVHTSGGCDSDDSNNYGLATPAIFMLSPLVHDRTLLSKTRDEMTHFSMRLGNQESSFMVYAMGSGLIEISKYEDNAMKLASNPDGSIFFSRASNQSTLWRLLLIDKNTAIIGQPFHDNKTLWLTSTPSGFTLSNIAEPLTINILQSSP